MEPSNPQRTPGPGTTWLRIADRTWTMPDSVWELWVRRGHVPPDAMVISLQWTRGVWRRADSLEVFHLFVPSAARSPAAGHAPVPPRRSEGPLAVPGSPEPLEGPSGARPGTRSDGLPVALTGHGVSVTQALLFANILISAALVWTWRSSYEPRLWAYSGELHTRLFSGWVPALLPPLFLHASAQHLLGNMVGLVAGGAAVEEFYGRTRTFLFYLFAGLCGAGLSLLRPKEVLSVGASGAIMGLYGVMLVFLLRYRRRFSERQKMKTIRIYLPMLALALLPGLFQADLLSHVGGFVGGILLALILPPQAGRIPWASEPEGDARTVAPTVGPERQG